MSKVIREGIVPEGAPLSRERYAQMALFPFVRNPYNYDMMVASDESGLACPEPTLAQQSAKDECDINVIVDRYMRTGVLPNADPSRAQYGDFTQFGAGYDLKQSVDYLNAADEAFMRLPAKLRSRFKNDPAELLDFVGDKKNLDEARELGLVDPLPLPVGEPVATQTAKGAPSGKVSEKPSLKPSVKDGGGNEGE